MSRTKTSRSRIFRILLVIGVLGVMGIGVFALMLRSWTVVRDIDTAQAEAELQQILDHLVDDRPYFEAGEDSALLVHRELETEDAAAVESLNLVSWNPNRNRWIRTEIPFWFVRMKTRHGIALGPLQAAMAEDWSHFSLDVAEGDLERRGPGLILHLRQSNGRQFLMWNAPKRDN